MPLMKSIFNFRYYKYIFKKTLPYLSIMTLIMTAINITVYGVCFTTADVLNVLDISLPNTVYLYIYPVLLGILLFKFLFTKTTSDFFGSMPVSRTELFLTNIAVGFTSILFTTAVNSIMLVVVLPLTKPGIVVAPAVFGYYFLYWTAAFFFTFVIMAFAATFSGSVVSQLLFGAVFAFIPGIMLQIVQLPVYNFIYSYSGGVSSVSIDNLLQSFSAPFYFINQLIFSIMKLDSFYGLCSGLSNIWVILYNFVFAVVLVFAGVIIMKKRRFEMASSTYAHSSILVLVKTAIFIPVMFLFFNVLISESNFGFGIFLLILIVVAYIIIDMILKKGIKNLGKSLLVLACCAVLGYSLNVFIDHAESLQTSNYLNNNQAVEELSVYMKPLGVYTNRNDGAKSSYVKLTFDDPALINYFKESSNNQIGDSESSYSVQGDLSDYKEFFIEVKTPEKTLTKSFSVSGAFADRLYELVDADPEKLAALDYTDKTVNMSECLTSYVQSWYKNDNSSPSEKSVLKIRDRKAVADIIDKLTAETRALSVKERYEIENYNWTEDVYSGRYYSYSGSMDSDLSMNSDLSSDITVKQEYLRTIYYDNGRYYYTFCKFPDGDVKREFLNNMNDIGKKQLSSSGFSKFKCKIESFPEKIYDLPLDYVSVLNNFAAFMPDELKEVALKVLPVTDSANTVRVTFTSGSRNADIFLDWDRDLIPLIDNIKSESLTAFENINNKNISSLKLNGFIDGDLKAFSSYVKYSSDIYVGKGDASLDAITDCLKPYINGSYYDIAGNAEIIKGKDIIMADIEYIDGSSSAFYFDVDEALIEKLDYHLAIKRKYSYGFYNSNIVEKIKVADVFIEEPEEIDYFCKAITTENVYSNSNGASYSVTLFLNSNYKINEDINFGSTVVYRDNTPTIMFTVSLSSDMKERIDILRTAQYAAQDNASVGEGA